MSFLTDSAYIDGEHTKKIIFQFRIKQRSSVVLKLEAQVGSSCGQFKNKTKSDKLKIINYS